MQKIDITELAYILTNTLSIIITEQRMITPIRCHRCTHEWNYGGKNLFVATCPHCRTQLSIRKHKVPQPGQDSRQVQAAGGSPNDPEAILGK